MMASSSKEDFEKWLKDYLDSAGVDGEVFSGYISGTLTTLEGSSPSELQESLLEVLQSCLEDESMCLTVCKHIHTHWQEEADRRKAAKLSAEEVLPAVKEDTSGSVSSSPTCRKEESGTGSQGNMSSEEKKKLLEQYDCESDGEDGEDDVGSRAQPAKGGGGGGKSGGIFVNNNTSIASDAQKLHREVLKAQHEAKLEWDRKDRETQRQRAQERKEKEKKRTQKQERRR